MAKHSSRGPFMTVHACFDSVLGVLCAIPRDLIALELFVTRRRVYWRSSDCLGRLSWRTAATLFLDEWVTRLTPRALLKSCKNVNASSRGTPPILFDVVCRDES